MKRIATFLILTTLGIPPLCAMPSQITFQGTLKQQGVPVNSPPNKGMQFTFVDSDGGNQIPGTSIINIANVTVTNGLFAVQLPIDPSFPWEQYTPYIRVSVEGQTLKPDQPLNANLYAVAATPPGTIVAFGGQNAPAGWFLCDGSSKNRINYSGLFQALGIAWGAGDGSTTFNLPDMRGRAPIGVGQGTGLTNHNLADMLGEETHTLKISEMPSHTHAAPQGQNFAVTGSLNNRGIPFATSALFNSDYNTTEAAGGDMPHNVMQPSAAVNFIIKY